MNGAHGQHTVAVRRSWLAMSMILHMRIGLAHIFLLKAVMSRDAFIMRSRRSWCSSSSRRKVSNMGMKGEMGGAAVSSSLWGCFEPAIVC